MRSVQPPQVRQAIRASGVDDGPTSELLPEVEPKLLAELLVKSDRAQAAWVAQRLRYMPKRRARLERETAELVGRLRGYGWTWAQVGNVAGVSKQAASARWRSAA